MYTVQFPKLGWEFQINPVAFTIGNLEIRWYGILIAAGFLLAFFYALASCKKMRINEDKLINCVIVSGTGQAAVTMPLMVPVSDLVGISRQTSVLAFQLGDGFSNSVLPMSSSLMGYLAVSKIPYSKWLKFMMPLFLIWTALGCLFMLGALMIGY